MSSRIALDNGRIGMQETHSGLWQTTRPAQGMKPAVVACSSFAVLVGSVSGVLFPRENPNSQQPRDSRTSSPIAADEG
jgi:hypothetical protein